MESRAKKKQARGPLSPIGVEAEALLRRESMNIGNIMLGGKGGKAKINKYDF